MGKRFETAEACRTYWKARRASQRAKAGLEHDFTALPRYRVMGEELRRMMQEPLAWPADLYSQMAQPLTQQKPRNDDLCLCGKEHRRLWPRTVRSTYGYGFNVFYYCSNACKSRAVKEGA